MDRKAAQQNKNTSEELKQAYLGTDRLTKKGEEGHRMCPLPPMLVIMDKILIKHISNKQ